MKCPNCGKQGKPIIKDKGLYVCQNMSCNRVVFNKDTKKADTV